MNILIVSQYFWPENFRINEVAADLVERGHEVTVLTGLPNYPGGRFFDGYGPLKGPWEQQWRGVRIIRVPLIPRGNSGGARLAVNYLSYVVTASLAGFFMARDVDAIFCIGLSPNTVAVPAALIKRLTGAPLLFWIFDLWPESLTAAGAVRSRRVIGAFDRLMRRIYSWCDRILVQSRAFFPSTQGHGARLEQLRYFPVSAERLFCVTEPTPDAPERAMMPEGFKVMFAGNMGEAQGFDTILDAAEMLREHAEIHWVVLGDGRKRSWVEEQIRARGLDGCVHLLGSHPLETMPVFYSLADVMLVSLKREDIFALTIPGKVQSYLACARPIVASLDGEGARVIREAGAGLTAPAGDSRMLADAVLKARALGPDGLRGMGLKGRAYFEEHFEADALLQRLEGWMHEARDEAHARRGVARGWLKRGFDLLLSIMLTLALSPLLLCIALAVKLTSPGPALYVSDRVGADKSIFRMYKFRTMRTDTPQVATHLMTDPKVYLTPIGRFLRKSSLDELPQLLNIIKGEMSFVGPRPALFNQDDLMALRTELGVHRLVPGLTGWAQIMGRDELPIPEKVRFDKYYLEHRSFGFDLKIMFLTIFKVMKQEGVDH
jgi:lipopolysaccharide/colanic/teichoic acid biosynthesis glycosyltransferase